MIGVVEAAAAGWRTATTFVADLAGRAAIPATLVIGALAEAYIIVAGFIVAAASTGAATAVRAAFFALALHVATGPVVTALAEVAISAHISAAV